LCDVVLLLLLLLLLLAEVQHLAYAAVICSLCN
jgi:hypothetical protein